MGFGRMCKGRTGALRDDCRYGCLPRIELCHGSSYRFYHIKDRDDFLGIGFPCHLQRSRAQIALVL